MRIGFDCYDHEGPGIFLSRLRAVLEETGRFDAENPDVWVNLSFKPVPETMAQRRRTGKTKILTRMDGAYCGRSYKIHKNFVLPVPVLDDWYSARINKKKNALIADNLLNADDIIFQSEFSRRLTQRFVTPTPPGQIVYNGIDLEAFSGEGSRYDAIADDGVKILVSHSFRMYHRLHDGLRILKQLRQWLTETVGRPVRLYVLGGDDGKAFDYARETAAQLQLREGEDFFFLGKLPFQSLGPVYRSCDFMLNLSYWDSCPNVVIEAMASGLPVLGVDYGGVAELVGEDGGILVPEKIPFTYIDHQNPDRMPKAPVDRYVAAALKLLERREAFSQSARLRAQSRYDIRRVAEAYIEVAEMLAAKAASPVV